MQRRSSWALRRGGVPRDPGLGAGCRRALRTAVDEVGPFEQMINGIFQGCAVSVNILNAVMGVLTRAIHRRIEGGLMFPFVDDAYVVVGLQQRVRHGGSTPWTSLRALTLSRTAQ